MSISFMRGIESFGYSYEQSAKKVLHHWVNARPSGHLILMLVSRYVALVVRSE
jgi:hypothetical protein